MPDPSDIREQFAAQVEAFVAAERHGYFFEIVPSAEPKLAWSARAAPLVPGRTGDRWFFVDESGVVRYSVGAEAGPASPAVGR